MAMLQQTFPFLKKIAHAIPPEPESEYRYVLYRSLDGEAWDEAGPGRRSVCFIMLNPSQASADTTDPTIDKLMKYGRAWGFQRLVVVNLFAYRETDSKKLRALSNGRDLVGRDNNERIRLAALNADLVVCGWGNGGDILGRGVEVKALLTALDCDLWCFKTTGSGEPTHPLYQRDLAELVRYR